MLFHKTAEKFAVVLLPDGFQIDAFDIAPVLEVFISVIDVRRAPAHSSGKIIAGAAQYHDGTASHIFTGMVSNTFHHGDSSGIAYGETFASLSAEIGFSGSRTVQRHIACYSLFRGRKTRIAGRSHDKGTAGKSFARIIIRTALHFEGDARGEEGSKTLSGPSVQTQAQTVWGKAGSADTTDDLPRKATADGTIGIAQFPFEEYAGARTVQNRLCGFFQRLFQLGRVSVGQHMRVSPAFRLFRSKKHTGEVELRSLAFQILSAAQEIGPADDLIE